VAVYLRMGPMKTTELVAWIGATTGIASLGWNIYTKITANRPKLVEKAYAGCPISRVLCEKWGFLPTPSQSSTSALSNFLLPPSPVVDPNQSRLSVSIGAVMRGHVCDG
jgi:hypothetical protein